jgi:hypothetical protein
MPNVYDVGDKVRISFAITGPSGALVDPTTVSGKFKTPTGTKTTYVYGTDAALVKVSTGNYYFDITINDDGQWHYAAISVDPPASAEGSFHVRRSQF